MGAKFEDDYYKFSKEHAGHTSQKLRGIAAARWGRRYAEAEFSLERKDYRDVLLKLYNQNQDLSLSRMAEEVLRKYR